MMVLMSVPSREMVDVENVISSAVIRKIEILEWVLLKFLSMVFLQV